MILFTRLNETIIRYADRMTLEELHKTVSFYTELGYDVDTSRLYR